MDQDDVDNGELINVADADADDPDGNNVNDDDGETVNLPQDPKIQILKSGVFNDENNDTFGQPLETVTYTYEVENTGNVTLDNLAVTDEFETAGLVGSNANLGPITCSLIPQGGTLDPGDTTTCTATYTLDQDDVDNGELINVADADADDPDGNNVNDDDGETVNLPQDPKIQILKSGVFNDENNDTFGQPLETVTYTYEVENTGNVTLDNLAVTDEFETAGLVGSNANLGPITCSLIPQGGTLDPGDTTTCTATYTLDQDDVDNGELINVADADADDPDGNNVNDDDGETVNLPQDPKIQILKSGVFNDENNDTFGQPLETVTYTYEVENTGNVTLDNLAVTDEFETAGLVGSNANLGPITCSLIPQGGTLDPGDTTTCTATYTLDQDDVDNGELINVADADADDPDGNNVNDDDGETVNLPQDPKIQILKSGVFNDENNDTFGQPLETVTYTYEVENTGNVTLDNLAVTDEFETAGLVGSNANLGPITCSLIPQGGTLDPGDTTTCTATYTLDQDDVDNGELINVADADADDPDGNNVNDDDGETVNLPQDPKIQILKSGVFNDENNDTFGQPLETVTYTYEVENTGNVTLDNLAVTDEFETAGLVGSNANLGPDHLFADPPGRDAADPGDTTTCTATYTLSQADVDEGQVVNLADADADRSQRWQERQRRRRQHRQPLPQNPSIDILKSGVFNDEDGDGYGRAPDETITYTYEVENDRQRHPGQPGGDRFEFETAGLVASGGQAGSDHLFADPPGRDAADPGDTTTCTATYTLDQDDVDNGELINVADADADDPDGNNVNDDDGETVNLPQDPKIQILKSGVFNDENNDTFGQPLETVTYTYEVENTGNVTLDNLAVTDEFETAGLVGSNANLGPITCSLIPQGGTLDPGDTTTCTATYTLDQDDVDNGELINVADADADDPDGNNVNDDDGETVNLPQDPKIQILKSGVFNDENNDTFGQPLETVTYTYEVENTGNVTLDNLAVTDEFETAGLVGSNANLGPITCSLIPQGGTLDPGDTTTCTATYTLDQDDVDNGELINVADADADDPDGNNVNDDDGETVNLPQDPKIQILKSGVFNDENNDTFGQPLETVTYTYEVENTGNVTLDNLAVTDEFETAGLVGSNANLGPITCSLIPQGGTLDPGDTTTCTATYTLDQDDVDNGELINVADADADDPDGNNVNDDDGETVNLPQDPKIQILKSGVFNDENNDTFGQPLETVTYTYEVENTGNVTLDNLAVTDEFETAGLVGSNANLGPITCSLIPQGGTLDPGDTTTCTATYTLDQDDVDNGELINVADADADDPDGNNVNDDDGETVNLPQDPKIQILKSGVFNDENNDTFGQPLETVTYTYEVENTGNVTLDNLAVTDEFETAGLVGSNANLGPITCSLIPQGGTLDPGDTTTCTATYTLDQDDVDNGELINVADADADDPDGNNVNDDDGETVNLPQDPKIQILKSGVFNDENNDTFGQPLETVTYTYEVENTGNVTLDNLAVTDEFETAGLVGSNANLGPITCSLIPQGGTLDPGDTTTCTATYTLDQDDVDNGELINVADADADDPDGNNVNDDDGETVNLPQDPKIQILKSGVFNDENNDTFGQPLETVTYTYEVENTGNVTLDNLAVTDEFETAGLVGSNANLGPITCSLIPQGGTLDPGDTTTCTATYTLDQDDVDNGELINVADADADDPDGNNVNDDDGETVNLPRIRRSRS